MKDAASIFPGTHDFRYFADEERGKSTLCDIKTISIRNDGDWFYLDIAGNRFMQHMVRKIAAALKLIGKGEKDGGWLAKMLDCSITDTLQPIEANGLILMNVNHPGIKWNIDSHARRKE